MFDALWVKIKGNWKYILALFDTKLNTLVAIDLVYSEAENTIEHFLSQSLCNQKVISIGTDLKHEYKRAVMKVGAKHHFCKFHVYTNDKQKN